MATTGSTCKPNFRRIIVNAVSQAPAGADGWVRSLKIVAFWRLDCCRLVSEVNRKSRTYEVVQTSKGIKILSLCLSWWESAELETRFSLLLDFSPNHWLTNEQKEEISRHICIQKKAVVRYSSGTLDGLPFELCLCSSDFWDQCSSWWFESVDYLRGGVQI